jgi:hypothetical protein
MGKCPSTIASIQRLAWSDKRRRASHLPAVAHAPRAEETTNIPRLLDRVREALCRKPCFQLGYLFFCVDTRLEGDERVLAFARGTLVGELIVALDDEKRRLAYYKLPQVRSEFVLELLNRRGPFEMTLSSLVAYEKLLIYLQ